MVFSHKVNAPLIIILCLIRGEFRQSGATAYYRCCHRRRRQEFALVSCAPLGVHFELDKKYLIYNRMELVY